MEAQLKASQEQSDRLRVEREQLRDRLSELQTTLREKEAEVRIRGQLVFKMNCSAE